MSEATTETPAAPQPQAPEPAKVEQRDADEPLREPGKKALQAERERADRLESEVNNLKPLKEQWERLQAVFGGKAEGETPEDVVKSLQQQVEQLHRVNQVNELARTFGITDAEDIARLTRIPDPDLRADIAARLTPAQAAAPAAPLTDPGQGARPGASSDDEYARYFPQSR